MDSSFTGRLQPRFGISLLQSQNTQAGAVSHFRMRLALQNSAYHLGGGHADSFSPVDQTRRAPLQMRLMTFGHMFGNRRMPVGSVAARM